jgi:hypothetical protein
VQAKVGAVVAVPGVMVSHQLPDVACMKGAAAGGVVAGAVGAGMATALMVTADGNESAPVDVISVKVTG